MGVNQVLLGAVKIMDISDSTVTADSMMAGDVAYGADGEKVVGTFSLDSEIDTSESLVNQIQAALVGKAGGGGTSDGSTETCTVTVKAFAPFGMGTATKLYAIDESAQLVTIAAAGVYTLRSNQVVVVTSSDGCNISGDVTEIHASVTTYALHLTGDCTIEM